MSILINIQNNTNGCLDNPSILSEYLLRLSASIMDCEKEKVEAEVRYASKWVKMRQGEEIQSDKHCDTIMKLEPEYIELKSKEAISKTLIETIRSVKKRLSFLAVEYNENLNNL